MKMMMRDGVCGAKQKCDDDNEFTITCLAMCLNLTLSASDFFFKSSYLLYHANVGSIVDAYKIETIPTRTLSLHQPAWLSPVKQNRD